MAEPLLTYRRFRYHKPSRAGVERIENVRQACRDLESVLLEHVPPGRELSLALTKLEEAAMWANKAIVLGDPDSTVID